MTAQTDMFRAAGTALFSADGSCRFTLTREWGPGILVCFIGLNPSTATADTDDPTIRRCIAFAKREGGERLLMLNLFAWRSTDPKALIGAPGIVGEPHEEVPCRAMEADVIICAWGSIHKSLRWRGDEIFDATCGERELFCLGYTKNGSPRHPLYTRGDAQLVPWPRPPL